MHRIYFEKRCLTVCSPEEALLADPNAIQFHPAEGSGFKDLVDMFEASSSLNLICITSEDVEGTYRKVCHEFKEVNAAGGLVSNKRGDLLLIRRFGLWDLPKGHQEAGEDIAITAMREVQEETGVKELQLRDLICVTDHVYRRDGIRHLKHTWWYDMLYTNPVDLTPQNEEDISKAAWVAKSSLPPLLKDTYPSIIEVFRNADI